MAIAIDEKATLKRWAEFKNSIAEVPEPERLKETARVLSEFTPDELFVIADMVSRTHSV